MLVSVPVFILQFHFLSTGCILPVSIIPLLVPVTGYILPVCMIQVLFQSKHKVLIYSFWINLFGGWVVLHQGTNDQIMPIGGVSQMHKCIFF